MGWHGVANATPGQQDPSFLPPLGNSVNFVSCCFFVIAKEGSPDMLV